MVQHCFVLNSKSDSRTDDEDKFFHFPAIISEINRYYVGYGKEAEHQRIIELSKKRQKCWTNAMRRGSLDQTQINNARICGKHFLSGKPADLTQEEDPDWVPNCNLGYEVGMELKRKSSLDSYECYDSSVKRTKLTEDCTIGHNNVPKTDTVGLPIQDYSLDKDDSAPAEKNNTVGIQTNLTMDNLVSLMEQLCVANKKNESMAQKLVNLDLLPQSFENDNKKTKYFTGLTDYRLLFLIHDTIASQLYCRSNTSLSTFQQLLLTLMKLRLNLPFKFLSYRFGVALFTVSRYFRRCLNVLYCKFKSLIYWPDRATLHTTMPNCFRQCFGTSVTTIIDCFEIFMESPANLCSSAQCWSHYKHHKTVKDLISISPQGSVMFISDSYGGRASDDYITQDSGFLDKITPGDLVLADRGFRVEELLNLRGSTMKVPAFTRGKKQLHPVELEDTRQTANVRIHVERVIGAMRGTYTILSGTVPITLLCTQENGVCVFDQILGVCCILINLRPSMVNPD